MKLLLIEMLKTAGLTDWCRLGNHNQSVMDML